TLPHLLRRQHHAASSLTSSLVLFSLGVWSQPCYMAQRLRGRLYLLAMQIYVYYIHCSGDASIIKFLVGTVW
ncbi:hypothetical protein EDD17DRAFT_1671533, partial [Pisolithus thermaeus]